jgi:hypothetical protein
MKVIAKQVIFLNWLLVCCEKLCSSNSEIFIVLWPLFHYIMWNDATDGRREAREWKAYHHVNQQFANAVIENYRKDDISKCRFCVIPTAQILLP